MTLRYAKVKDQKICKVKRSFGRDATVKNVVLNRIAQEAGISAKILHDFLYANRPLKTELSNRVLPILEKYGVIKKHEEENNDR